MQLPDGVTFQVEFDPAWDKRAEDPNLGQHFAQFRFAIIGPRGAVEWTLFTGWTVESALQGPVMAVAHSPIPAVYGAHTRVTADTPGARACHLVGHCLDDGGSFRSDHLYKALVIEGYDGVAQLLLKTYRGSFKEE